MNYVVICSLCCRSQWVLSLGVVLLFPCSAGVLLFRYSVVIRLFRQFSVVLQVLLCSPVFRCFVRVLCSVIPCSWFYSIPLKIHSVYMAISLRQRANHIYMVFTTEELFEVAIESWPEWDLNPRPLNSVQTL